MRFILLSVLLCAGLIAHAQDQPFPLGTKDLYRYPGTPAVITGAFIRVGSPVALTAVAYYAPGKAVLPLTEQPTFTITGGSYFLRWTGVQTKSIGTKWAKCYVEVYAAGVVIRTANVNFAYVTQPIDPGQLLTIDLSTVTKEEVDSLKTAVNLLAAQPSTQPLTVATFAAAQALVTPGIAKSFVITLYAPWGIATFSRYNGTSWLHSPAIFSTN